MTIQSCIFNYDYSPYCLPDGKEQPAFEIFNEKWDKVADTNENQSAEYQEQIARLFAASGEMFTILKEAGKVDWVHNAALTHDIEALRKICLRYCAWWNDRALPILERIGHDK